jgi:hypothetical protein
VDFYLKTVGGSEPELEVSDDDDDDDDIIALPLGNRYPTSSQCCGSVINWSPGSGTVIRNYGSRSKIQRNFRKNFDI